MSDTPLVKGDTKSRILDAAEKLFAVNGFQETSLRDITTEADVNLAAVNYHFQSKDSLMDAVIARRIEPINLRRLALLDAVGDHPSLEQILRAFLDPIVNAPVEVLAPLLGRVMSNPDLFVDRVFHKHLAPLSQRFVHALRQAAPELPPAEVMWRLHYCVGVMTHLLLWGSILPRLSGGVCDTTDRQALLDRTVGFLAAGFNAPTPACASRLQLETANSQQEPMHI